MNAAKITTNFPDVAGVAMVYGASIALLLVGEILLARNISPSDFGTYNLVKQAVPVGCAVALLGFDQALTREAAARGKPTRVDRSTAVLALRGAGAGAVGALYLVLGLGVSWWAGLCVVVATTGLVISSVVSGLLRATGNAVVAALAQQSYRLGAGLVFLLFVGRLPGVWPNAVLAGTAAIVAILCVAKARTFSDLWRPTQQEIRLLRRLGYGYVLGLLGMTVCDWLDQTLIAELADTATVGHYAQAKLLAVYPLLSLGSIAGFLALPYIASRRDSLSTRKFARWMVAATLGCCGLALVVGPCSLVGFNLLFGIYPDGGLIAVLAAVGGARLLYVLPSAALGAIGSARQLAAAGGWSVVGVGLQAAVTLAAASGHLPVAVAASLGLLTFVIVRLVSSTVLTVVALEGRKRMNEASA